MCLVVLTKADISDDVSDYVQRASRLALGLMVEAVNALERKSLGNLDAGLAEG